MATPYDCSIGVGVEGTYGTLATPTNWFEFTDESFEWKPTRKVGMGLRVNGRVARSLRRVTTTVTGEGKLEVEAVSKGLGKLLQAALGSGTSTLVAGTTYQQNFILGDTPSALTIQKGIPRDSGTIDPYSFLGCTTDSWSFTAPTDDIPKFSFEYTARDLDTATGLTAVSYPTTPSLFSFSMGAATYGGVVTVPTSTAIATGGTAAIDIRDFEMTVNNNQSEDRFNFGASGKRAQPKMGLREITGKFTAAYTAKTYRAAHVADTVNALTLTFTGTEALSTGFATLQIVLPAITLESATPVSNNGDLVVVEHTFTAYDNSVAAQPIYVVLRTADAAI